MRGRGRRMQRGSMRRGEGGRGGREGVGGWKVGGWWGETNAEMGAGRAVVCVASGGG